MKNLILILLIIPIHLFGQGWERTYESGFGRSVQQTTDGGYVITGRTEQTNPYDLFIFLIRTNSDGDTVWTKKYGGPYDDYGFSVQQTTDEGFIISGYISDNWNCSVYLIKTDSNGDTLWTRTYAENGWCMGYSVKQCSDEGYIIAGFTKLSYIDNDVYLIKTDGNGDTLWTRTYGVTDSDYGYSVQQTIDGGYIITGETHSYSSGNRYVFLIKTDSNGYTEWTKTFGEASYSLGYSVEQTSDEGYIITGITGEIESQDVFLIKTNSNGNTIWTKTFGGIDHDKGHSVKQTIDGGYIVAGTTHTNETGNDVYLIKTNSNGDTIWTKTFGGSANDYGYSVQITFDGGYIIGGSSYSTNIDMMLVYLIKTDENGIITSTTEISVPNPNKKLIRTVDLSGREINKPQTNIPYIEIYNDGTTQKKMRLK